VLSDLPSIVWLHCKQPSDSVFEFYHEDELLSTVDLENGIFDLDSLVAIVVVGSNDSFESIKKLWSSKLPAIGVTFRGVSDWEEQAIVRAALECIGENLALHRTHSGRVSLELATYRREFDRLQRKFARLEEYIGRQSLIRPTEIFEYPPDGDTVAQISFQDQLNGDGNSSGGFLTQCLPVDSLGLSSLSIYVGSKPEDEGAPLVVKLRAVETGTVFAKWSIDPSSVESGWVDLTLRHAIDEPALTLELVFECQIEDSGWALALGPPHPFKEVCARTQIGECEHLTAPIAFRVFSTLPGVLVPATTSSIKPIDTPHLHSEFVPSETYATATQVFPSLYDNKPPLVFYDREIGCLTVHPRVGGITVARMRVVVPKHAWGITAQIHLAHEQASPTAFALFVCPPQDEKGSLARLNQLELPSPSFSGWKTLSPLETKGISVVLGASAEEELSLYLATRQAPDFSPDFAWARFSKFGFNLLLPSLKDEILREPWNRKVRSSARTVRVMAADSVAE
jgi:hypothetical protein